MFVELAGRTEGSSLCQSGEEVAARAEAVPSGVAGLVAGSEGGVADLDACFEVDDASRCGELPGVAVGDVGVTAAGAPAVFDDVAGTDVLSD